jgi:NTE family protein
MNLLLKEWLKDEPFTLTLSSGFFGFFAHTGFLAALEEEDLKPTLVTGSSAGALAGGSWAAGVSAEDIRKDLFSLTKEEFWDPGIGPGLLKGDLFKNRLEKLLPVKNMNETKIPFKASAFDFFGQRTKVLDTGDLSKVIRASCAVPFLFQPVWIEKKPYLDGGIRDRPALDGVPANNRVLYHHLISNSWWRFHSKECTRFPIRENMHTIAIKNLPKMGPNKLANGEKAYQKAYTETKKLLNLQMK